METTSKRIYATNSYSDPPLSTDRLGKNYSTSLASSALQWRETEDSYLDNKSGTYAERGKRLLDIVVSLFVLFFVLSWLLPIISLIVLFDSRGPIFFMQHRTGRRGVTFSCFKFRTMYHQSSKQSEFKQTSFNDSRVTRSGRFLRRTNLDELPQFINVLLGDMSIIGPRPHAVQHDAFYWNSKEYRSRYSIKPGITGLAQIRGSRGETDKDQKMMHRVKYDLFYASRQSLKLDIAIFLWTIGTMVKGDKNAW